MKSMPFRDIVFTSLIQRIEAVSELLEGQGYEIIAITTAADERDYLGAIFYKPKKKRKS